jgi:hypothetical protein
MVFLILMTSRATNHGDVGQSAKRGKSGTSIFLTRPGKTHAPVRRDRAGRQNSVSVTVRAMSLAKVLAGKGAAKVPATFGIRDLTTR